MIEGLFYTIKVVFVVVVVNHQINHNYGFLKFTLVVQILVSFGWSLTIILLFDGYHRIS
jgi:hypothetical protein